MTAGGVVRIGARGDVLDSREPQIGKRFARIG